MSWLCLPVLRLAAMSKHPLLSSTSKPRLSSESTTRLAKNALLNALLKDLLNGLLNGLLNIRVALLIIAAG
jgi:hypothetical protein